MAETERHRAARLGNSRSFRCASLESVALSRPRRVGVLGAAGCSSATPLRQDGAYDVHFVASQRLQRWRATPGIGERHGDDPRRGGDGRHGRRGR